MDVNISYQEGTLDDINNLQQLFLHNHPTSTITLQDIIHEITSFNRASFISIATAGNQIVAFDIRFARTPDLISIYLHDRLPEANDNGILDQLSWFANERTERRGFKQTAWLAPAWSIDDLHLAGLFRGRIDAFHDRMWLAKLGQHHPVVGLICPIAVERHPLKKVDGLTALLQVVRDAERSGLFRVFQDQSLLGEVACTESDDFVMIEPHEERTWSSNVACCAVGNQLAASGRLLGVPQDRPDLAAAFCSMGYAVVGLVGEIPTKPGIVFLRRCNS